MTPRDDEEPYTCAGCGAELESDADEFECDDCLGPVCDACEKTTHKCPILP